MNQRFKAALIGLSITVFLLQAAAQSAPNTALVNGKWFDGKAFTARTVYSVEGRFTSKRPTRIENTVDLAGLWVIPPLAEAHNHSIGTGVDEWDRRAINRFLADGVFYVKIMGNLPLSIEAKNALPRSRDSRRAYCGTSRQAWCARAATWCCSRGSAASPGSSTPDSAGSRSPPRCASHRTSSSPRRTKCSASARRRTSTCSRPAFRSRACPRRRTFPTSGSAPASPKTAPFITA